MRRVLVLSCLVAAVLVGSAGVTGAAAPAGRYPADPTLRLNQLQVVGSHNSYHKRPNPVFHDALEAKFPGITAQWNYEHAPLPEQFTSQGVRQIELDVWADPVGGLFADRKSHAYAGLPADPGIPELHEPGFKVLHIHEVDVESTCWTLQSCLAQVKAWSDANPGHAPMMLLIEAKEDVIPDLLSLGYAKPVPFDAAQLDALDAEIRSAFDPGDIITPDEVRGSHPTLEDAVLNGGWPTLEQSRGRVLFGLDNGGGVQDAYLAGHPSLQGRVMFSGNSDPGNPETAFIKYNDPIGDYDKIRAAVAAGYIVRTRADADPQQLNPNLIADRDQALASGAQFVSTDFEVPDPALGPYQVQMPGGTPARCNPISAPAGCTSTDIENPLWLAAAAPEPPTTTTTTSTTTTTAVTPSAAPATAVATSPRYAG